MIDQATRRLRKKARYVMIIVPHARAFALDPRSQNRAAKRNLPRKTHIFKQKIAGEFAAFDLSTRLPFSHKPPPRCLGSGVGGNGLVIVLRCPRSKGFVLYRLLQSKSPVCIQTDQIVCQRERRRKQRCFLDNG
jgi:hypothetical protein